VITMKSVKEKSMKGIKKRLKTKKLKDKDKRLKCWLEAGGTIYIKN
jgi:hypothetical protein